MTLIKQHLYKNLSPNFRLNRFLYRGGLNCKFYPDRFLNLRFLLVGFYCIVWWPIYCLMTNPALLQKCAPWMRAAVTLGQSLLFFLPLSPQGYETKTALQTVKCLILQKNRGLNEQSNSNASILSILLI